MRLCEPSPSTEEERPQNSNDVKPPEWMSHETAEEFLSALQAATAAYQ